MPRRRKLSDGYWTMVCHACAAMNRLLAARAQGDQERVERATKILARAGIHVTFTAPEDPAKWAKQWREASKQGSAADDEGLA